MNSITYNDSIPRLANIRDKILKLKVSKADDKSNKSSLILESASIAINISFII